MDVYKSEDEQVEAIKQWWEENGKSIITGVVLGLGAIFGWRAWQDYTREQAESASEIYQNLFDMTAEESNPDEIRTISNKIIEDYDTTAYAVFTKFLLARHAVETNDYDAAANHLRWALENNRNSSIGHVIRLRLVRVLINLEQLDEAGSLLSIDDRGEFAAAYDELQGDIMAMKGDVEDARKMYQQAMTGKRTANHDTSILEIKLDDLGRPEQE